MKRLTGLLLCFIIAYTQVISTSALAQTQTNTSGSNTAITGGYTSSSSNTYQSGSSSNIQHQLQILLMHIVVIQE